MTAFSYEIANVTAQVVRAFPGNPDGGYAIPWYLVLGDPGTGRSTVLHAMNLTWQNGDGPLQIGLPQQLCTYWMPREAVFIEPEATVLGPRRNPELLKQLCGELLRSRPREPIDGVILVLNIADFIDQDERGIEAYANNMRRYLIEVGQALQSDVPVYLVVIRYDTLWGFAEVFQWGPDRKGEEPWGFTLSLDTAPNEAQAKIMEQLVGLNARLEAFCLAKLSSEDNVEQRVRAFQHVAEVRAFMDKLRQVFQTLAMANSFESPPWIRAMAIGTAVPGVGERLRAGIARFSNMGLQQGHPAAVGALRPGGLPIHAYMTSVILPEKEIVPLRTRWRDDKLMIALFGVGLFLWIAAMITGVVFSLTAKDAPPRPGVTAPAKK
ncbi:MAG: type VI secretion system protein [Byssovorax sp.]